MVATVFQRDEILSPREREQFLVELLTFQLDELNGFGDQIVFAIETGELDATRSHQLARRCRLVVDAVVQASPSVASLVRKLLDAKPPGPDDLFGVVLTLLAIEGETPAVAHLIACMPEARRGALAVIRAADGHVG